MRVVLTIAGSDPIAGAGIQADLKTFAALGVYGTSALTAVTSQNTAGIGGVFALPADVVRSQLDCVVQDVRLSATKTGMLATADIIGVVCDALARLERPNLVVDPVMAATSPGRRTLLAPDAVSILKSRLLPLASVVTPNTSEAGALAGIPVESADAAREAARRILDLGAKAVVVKGGHLSGAESIDLLFDGRTFTEFSAPRSSRGPIHGTGCTFASALAAGLALGDDLPAAVDRAKRYVTGAIQRAVAIGRGAAVLDHFWNYTDLSS
ncbi:MAG TPA: bifunctional hydroxymethylpyrimidine kinase/phosphomethylpyrimidine kinase [Vicinamibacterales bacterium]|jgi:hydroxymethylpyrimidine/phosphomethylpyrimidine kinase|nr:bifunctional hydroxymethylpyrimidine kinase/phosphomethylpyrimidine kinase [Vicinamibacterales bacterium]